MCTLIETKLFKEFIVFAGLNFLHVYQVVAQQKDILCWYFCSLLIYGGSTHTHTLCVTHIPSLHPFSD